jgi:cytochrome c biogenesis protein CcmG/thiol:disulfide interchange protein DsbE
MTEPVGALAPQPGRRWGRHRLVSLAVGIVLAAALWIGLTVAAPPGSQTAPAFSLPRLGGGAPVSYPLTGKEVHRPVVLKFFASWCGPCHAELPMIARVARQEQASGADVVFVGVDGNDDPASGLAFARKSGVAFAVGTNADSGLAPKFTLVGYPGTVFIDGSGKIVQTVHGPVSRATLETYLGRLSGP